MKNLGDLAEDQVIDFTFSTHAGDGTPTTLSGTPSLAVYKANGTTQSAAGITLDVDFDSVTGLNHVRIDTSADAFYAVANDYSVVIAAGTVDSVSVVGTTLAVFSIENRTTFPKADMPANFSSLAIDTDGCVSADIIKIRGSELAAKMLAARNYAYMDDQVVTVELEADDTDAVKGAKLAAAYAAAKLLTPGGAAISSTNRVKVQFPDTRYDMGESDFTLDTNGIDLFAMVPEVGGDNLPTDNDLSNGTTPLTQCRAPSTCIYTTALGHHTIEQSAADVRMSGFGILHLGTGATTEGCHALYVSATDNAPSIYDRMYFWHRAPYLSTTVAQQRFPVGFAKHVKGIWKWCIANSAAWRVGYDAADESVMAIMMEDCQFGSWSVAGDYLSGRKGTHKVTNTTMRRCKGVGCYAGSSSGYACVAGCGQWALDIDNTCVFEYLEIGDRGLGIGAKNEALQIYCRGGECCCGATTLSSVYNGEFAGTDIGGVFGAGSFGGVNSDQWDDPEIVRLTGTLIGSVVRGTHYPYRASGATIKNTLIQMATGSNADSVVLMDSTSKITGSTLIADGTGKAINADSSQSFAGTGNHYGGGLGANVTNTGTGDDATLTAAYDAAKTAAQAGDAMTLANDAIKASTFDESTAYPLKSADTGATAVMRSGADADTGKTLSDQIDGVATASALTTLANKFTGLTSVAAWLRAIFRKDAADATAKSEINAGGGTFNEATDSIEGIRDTAPLGTAMATPLDAAGVRSAVGLATANLDTQLGSIKTDTGTTLPAAISEIEAGTGGTVDVDIDVEDIIVE